VKEGNGCRKGDDFWSQKSEGTNFGDAGSGKKRSGQNKNALKSTILMISPSMWGRGLDWEKKKKNKKITEEQKMSNP